VAVANAISVYRFLAGRVREPKDLRGTFASMSVIQALMGHAEMIMTRKNTQSPPAGNGKHSVTR
jgi:hypothetical protein